MRPEHLLHLERRHLVTAGLDDVYARAAEHPVCAVFRDGDVAGADPAVPERCSSRVGPPPILEEHRLPTHFDLARRARRHRPPASSTRRTSTPGSGVPTNPGRRSPCSGLASAIPISVMP